MAVVANDKISKTELINRFGVVLRDYIVSQTDWVASTPIAGGQTAAMITNGTGPLNPNGSNNPGVLPTGKAQTTKDPGIPAPTSITDEIEADLSNINSITRVFRDFMVLYARNQMVRFNNTGNYGGVYTDVIRLSTSNGLDAAMTAQVNNAIVNRGLTGEQVIDVSNIEAFFNDCKNIWNALCNTSAVATYNFYYCHSNHTNYSQHGSRGRR